MATFSYSPVAVADRIALLTLLYAASQKATTHAKLLI